MIPCKSPCDIRNNENHAVGVQIFFFQDKTKQKTHQSISDFEKKLKRGRLEKRITPSAGSGAAKKHTKKPERNEERGEGHNWTKIQRYKRQRDPHTSPAL